MPKRRQKKQEIKIENKKKTNKTNDIVILEKIAKQADVEKKKILLMRVGVACVMFIFFVAWIFNLKYQFKLNSNNVSKSSFDWEQTKAELNNAMNQMKDSFSEIKQVQETNQQNTLPLEPELTNEQVNLLKGKLMNEIATSTTASSTVKN